MLTSTTRQDQDLLSSFNFVNCEWQLACLLSNLCSLNSKQTVAWVSIVWWTSLFVGRLEVSSCCSSSFPSFRHPLPSGFLHEPMSDFKMLLSVSTTSLALTSFRWVQQLLTIRPIFLPWPSNFLSCSQPHPSNKLLSIQLFLWAWYLQSKFITPVKHLGLTDFWWQNTGSLSPSALAAAIPVNRTLLCLPPMHFLDFKCSNLSGKALYWKCGATGSLLVWLAELSLPRMLSCLLCRTEPCQRQS